MSDNLTLNTNTTSGKIIATTEIGGNNFQIVKTAFGGVGVATQVDASNPLPVTVISEPANSALAAGNNKIGSVGIDQTTVGTTDSVTVKGLGNTTDATIVADTTNGSIHSRLIRLTQRVSSLIDLFPTSLGIKTAANSISVAPASDATFQLKAGSALAGKFSIDQVTANANEVVVKSTLSQTNISVAAYVSNKIIKATAGTLYRITGFNSSASAQFIQLHDAATLPADTAVPVLVQKVAAGSNFVIEFGSIGRAFSTGIVVANSSTGPTLTIGSADLWIDAQYS